MTDTIPDQEPLPGSLDALEEVVYRYEQFAEAASPSRAASALVALGDAISDLKSFHPGWDFETGTMPWDREED